jgi:hypothetical protein
MAFDPSKTVQENLADLHAQFAAADAREGERVRAYFKLTAADWNATPARVRDILADAMRAEV